MERKFPALDPMLEKERKRMEAFVPCVEPCCETRLDAERTNGRCLAHGGQHIDDILRKQTGLHRMR